MWKRLTPRVRCQITQTVYGLLLLVALDNRMSGQARIYDRGFSLFPVGSPEVRPRLHQHPNEGDAGNSGAGNQDRKQSSPDHAPVKGGISRSATLRLCRDLVAGVQQETAPGGLNLEPSVVCYRYALGLEEQPSFANLPTITSVRVWDEIHPTLGARGPRRT